jgi:NADPH-dependent 2,4-dienoyl-CoA reductase/sulfur reductase-like enzyme/Pyruvate/2-oxoacid:ferredoxin oxidoreductase delta subunit/bacterioferritin-associated ferredoxin
MSKGRIRSHPILEILKKKEIKFNYNGKKLTGYSGEVISSALIAAGIDIFGHHDKDDAPQGIFCANGQCAQCMVIVNGIPKKACMTELEPGMHIQSCEGYPELPLEKEILKTGDIKTKEFNVLIIGGGPAGLSAAIELGKCKVKTLLIDDKAELGGKLLLQTHKFFGSIDDCYAGTRGINIAKILHADVKKLKSVSIWLNTTALAVFSDNKIGVLKDNEYFLIEPKKILMATGAREKMLSFVGNTLPGVYGAGAFQTLVNRDLVRASNRLFIIGGGNVGLIAGYHALQAGIEVVGLVEALPKCGGYMVHEDKLSRLGVPIYTSHTIMSANGKDAVKSITISKIDKSFKPIKGTEKTFKVDTILIAVGLSPVDELFKKAKEFGYDIYSAGDAQEIAEASSAMFSGKIAGHNILKSLGIIKEAVSKDWNEKAEILKSPPGKILKRKDSIKETGIQPVFHCTQEIPCNPCISVCPQDAICIEDQSITGLPYFDAETVCKGCMRCVAVCPGLAITLINYRKDRKMPIVTIPFEVGERHVEKGMKIIVTDVNGSELKKTKVEKITKLKDYKETVLVGVKLTNRIARVAAGIRLQPEKTSEPSKLYLSSKLPDSAIICRCERVTAGEIRAWIGKGITDLNQLKAITRAGMGACGAKTCRDLIFRLFREEKIPFDIVTDRIDRPLFIEVPLGVFANVKNKQNSGGGARD